MFGVGGDIAYKNLKRNKKRYRTTVISIVVSVSIFIGMSSFVNYVSKIQNYIENPKKNKFSISFNQKYFYLNKEIKAARKKNVLRLFKKGYCELKNDFSIELKLKKGKIQKLQDGFKLQSACILAFSKNDIITSTINIMELNKNTLKSVTNKPSVFLKPICTFLYWYFIKKAIFEGRAGFIYSTKKYFEKFLLEVMLLEKRSKK